MTLGHGMSAPAADGPEKNPTRHGSGAETEPSQGTVIDNEHVSQSKLAEPEGKTHKRAASASAEDVVSGQPVAASGDDRAGSMVLIGDGFRPNSTKRRKMNVDALAKASVSSPQDASTGPGPEAAPSRAVPSRTPPAIRLERIMVANPPSSLGGLTPLFLEDEVDDTLPWDESDSEASVNDDSDASSGGSESWSGDCVFEAAGVVAELHELYSRPKATRVGLLAKLARLHSRMNLLLTADMMAAVPTSARRFRQVVVDFFNTHMSQQFEKPLTLDHMNFILRDASHWLDALWKFYSKTGLKPERSFDATKRVAYFAV